MKALEEICKPDSRFSYYCARKTADGCATWAFLGEQQKPITLEEYYQEVASIKLHESVSDLVKEQFEVAKNAALYAWFVWDFFDLAAHKALDCFELSLKDLLGKAEKDGLELDGLDLNKATLSPLIDKAVELHILKEERKESQNCRLENCNLVGRNIRSCQKGFGCPSKSFTLASYLLWLRNHFSHGYRWTQGVNALDDVLQKCAELISVMYAGEIYSNYNNRFEAERPCIFFENPEKDSLEQSWAPI